MLGFFLLQGPRKIKEVGTEWNTCSATDVAHTDHVGLEREDKNRKNESKTLFWDLGKELIKRCGPYFLSGTPK